MTTQHNISLGDLARLFGKIGFISFGGPAGQIALMHEEVVERRQWVDEDEYLQALNLCHLLPGPEAQQLAAWIGWRLHGVAGGLLAGLLFLIPGAFVMLGLSALYVMAMGVDWLQGLFFGIKAAVLAIVVQALLRIAGKALTTPAKRGLAVIAFVALFVLHIPFPLLIAGAAIVGAIMAWKAPAWVGLNVTGASLRAQTVAGETGAAWLGHLLKTLVFWGAIWAAPMIVIALTLGQDHILWKIGAFFSQLGLGLAETTPGPLILVTQFVGFLAGFRAPEPFGPWTAGLLAAGLTTWVTFAPCFLWIFALAPLMERLRNIAWLQGSLAAITAAVVGVIANLSLWFALHVLFGTVGRLEGGVGAIQGWIWWPIWETINVSALAIGLLAAALLFWMKRGIIVTLLACAALGLGLALLAP